MPERRVHDHAKDQRLKRADDAHGREGQHADDDLALGPGDIGKQLFQLLPSGNGFRGGRLRRVHSEHGRTGGTAHLCSRACEAEAVDNSDWRIDFHQAFIKPYQAVAAKKSRMITPLHW